MEQLPQRAHVRQVCLPILCCHLCHEIRITRRAEATWRRRPPSVEAEHVRCALGIERIWLTEIAIELIECLQGEGARPPADAPADAPASGSEKRRMRSDAKIPCTAIGRVIVDDDIKRPRRTPGVLAVVPLATKSAQCAKTGVLPSIRYLRGREELRI